MAKLETPELDRLVSLLRRKRAGEVALADMVVLVDATARTLKGFVESIDSAVFRELEEIASYIDTLRREIGALQAGNMSGRRLPALGQELDAIVRATESASHTILSCAEEVMAADAKDSERYREFVRDRMLSIFEACSFQDLTGQRIAKVVDTLKQIEGRVARFAAATRVEALPDVDSAPSIAGDSISQEAVDEIIGASPRKRTKS